MNWLVNWLTENDAKLLWGGLSTIVIPFAVSWIKGAKWSDTAKFALAVILSLLGGFLTAYIANAFKEETSFIGATGVIFLFAQGVYFGAFRGLGLERVISPKNAMIQLAQDEVKNQLSEVSTAQAKDILDKNTPPAVDVTATVVNKKDDVINE